MPETRYGQAGECDSGRGKRHGRQPEAPADHQPADQGAARIAEVEGADIERGGDIGGVARAVEDARLQGGDGAEGGGLPSALPGRLRAASRSVVSDQVAVPSRARSGVRATSARMRRCSTSP